ARVGAPVSSIVHCCWNSTCAYYGALNAMPGACKSCGQVRGTYALFATPPVSSAGTMTPYIATPQPWTPMQVADPQWVPGSSADADTAVMKRDIVDLKREIGDLRATQGGSADMAKAIATLIDRVAELEARIDRGDITW